MRYLGVLTYQEAFSWLEAVPWIWQSDTRPMILPWTWGQQAHSDICGCDVCCLLPRQGPKQALGSPKLWAKMTFSLYMLIISDIYYNQRNLPCIFMNEEYEENMAFTFQTKHRLLLRSSHPNATMFNESVSRVRSGMWVTAHFL